MSEYGRKFDQLANRWAAFEFEHDQVHPDRDQCGGVGGCPMMRQAHDLETKMMEEMETWRSKKITE